MDVSLLENRDYTIVLAKTSTSIVKAPPGYENRWQNAYESIINLARACQKFDTDGVKLYIACRNSPENYFEQYKLSMPDELREIVKSHYPPDELDLLGVLKNIFDDYLTRKAARQTKANGEVIIVLIDGEPRYRMDIAKVIVEATEKLEHDTEISIGFVQIGENLLARGFLRALDDDLTMAGAKFDIVDTQLIEQMQEHSLLQFLLDIIND
jgi:hypothetical protein